MAFLDKEGLKTIRAWVHGLLKNYMTREEVLEAIEQAKNTIIAEKAQQDGDEEV